MKQPWFCEACKTKGTCTIARGADVFHGMRTVNIAHKRRSVECHRLNGDTKIRVRNPAKCSLKQWRQFIRGAGNWEETVLLTNERMGKSRPVQSRFYSGKGSEWFWTRVNKIPWSQGGEAVYSLGCALQDLESRVMTQLENSEQLGDKGR